MKVVRSSPLRTGRLYPQEFSWYSFLEAESTPGHMVPSVAKENIPSDATGDGSRDCLTSSAVNCYSAEFKIRGNTEGDWFVQCWRPNTSVGLTHTHAHALLLTSYCLPTICFGFKIQHFLKTCLQYQRLVT
jgi:hypothetical protein